MQRRSASSKRVALALGVALVSMAVVPEWWAPPQPIVTDAAGLLSAQQRTHMERYHRLLLVDHDLDYRVELVNETGDLDRYAHTRFSALDVGSRSDASRGLLLVLDAGTDLVRIEVGHGLEGVFPDAFVAYLEQRQMVPYFRAGQVGDGVLAATELLVTRIQNAKARAGWETEPWAAGSGGAGARTRAHLGQGPETSDTKAPEVPAQSSPAEAVRVYIEAMRARNARPDLDLYTAGTRAMLAGRVITRAQMDAVTRAYRSCPEQEVRIGSDGAHAVIRYPVESRGCAPFLLVREDGRWRLDFETAAQAIRFGRSNAWHLVHEKAGPYAFAFEDWRFDRHGFPHANPGA